MIASNMSETNRKTRYTRQSIQEWTKVNFVEGNL